MQPTIETFTGVLFRPLAPVLDDIYIEDIAHGLSNECRFGSQPKKFYSVAEHSVRVAQLLQDWGEDEDVQFWGLMHDASEAYLKDFPTPLKQSEFGEAYRRAEETLMRAICKRFSMAERMPEQVKIADAILLATEARDLMSNSDHWKGLYFRPLPGTIEPLPPTWAEQAFLTAFRRLDGDR